MRLLKLVALNTFMIDFSPFFRGRRQLVILWERKQLSKGDSTQDLTTIIDGKPHWIVTWGSVFIFSVLFIFIVLSCLIKLPCTIEGPIRAVAENGSEPIVSPKSGRISMLLVNNGAKVKKGQPVAFIQGSGNHQQILVLQEWIGEIESLIDSGDFRTLLSRSLPKFDETGELEPVCEDVKVLQKLALKILKDHPYWNKRQKLSGISSFNTGLLALKALTDAWVLQHVVFAPMNGAVFMNSNIQVNKLVNAGHALFYIFSASKTLFTQMMVARSDLVKIRVGQQVIIKYKHYQQVDSFHMTGRVNSILNGLGINDSSKIEIEIQVEPLGTKYESGRLLDLSTNAVVICGDRTLLRGLLQEIRTLIK